MNTNLLNGKEIAAVLHISKALVYKLMSQGDIPTIHISRKTIRVKQEDLEAYIARNSSGQNSNPSNPE